MANCPTCAGKGKIKDRSDADAVNHHRFGDELLSYLRRNPNFRRESCLLCVEKHISAAMAYQRELLKAQDSGTADGQGEINIYMNFLSVIGELNLAAEEAEEWQELYTMLKAVERTARYEHILPNYAYISAKILEVKKTITGGENVKFTEAVS